MVDLCKICKKPLNNEEEKEKKMNDNVLEDTFSPVNLGLFDGSFLNLTSCCKTLG